MNLSLIIIGIAANVINILYNVPLIYRPWKNRCVNDISAYFVSMRILGTSLWIVYGIVAQDAQIIVLNSVTLLSSLCLIIFVLMQCYGICGFISKHGSNAIVPTINVLPITLRNNSTKPLEN